MMAELIRCYKYGTVLIIMLLALTGCKTITTNHILGVRQATAEYREVRNAIHDNLQASVWGEAHNPDPEIREVFGELVRDIVGIPSYNEARFAENANLLDAQQFRLETHMLLEKLKRCEKLIDRRQTTLFKAHSRSVAWQGFWLGIGGLSLLPLLWFAWRFK